MSGLHFTTRQKDVLAEVCKGKTNKQIARELGISEATVKIHLTEAFKEMGVKSRTQAILKIGASHSHVVQKSQEISDLEILKEFTDLAFSTFDDRWSQRVLKFGRAICRLTIDKSLQHKEA